MKRLILASVVLVSLVALIIWGNRLLARTLDAELAPLLSKELGLPVQLGPIQAQAIQLKATSPTLVMGDPNDPAVVAQSVEVTLSWPDLLRGEVRLVYASASDLMVRPSRWPSSDDPLPDDYRFLDPYLPRSLTVESGRYVGDDGEDYAVHQLLWQRHEKGRATAHWKEQGTTGEISLALELQSLSALLQLAPIAMSLTVQVNDAPDSLITANASVQPGSRTAGQDAAYEMQLDVQGAGLTANIVATGQTRWTLPDHSEATLPSLDSTRLSKLLDSYRKPETSDDLAAQLASTVPRLDLPVHDGHVTITELTIGDELAKDTAFDFTTGPQGIKITALTSSGPAALLTGDLNIDSSTQGWTLTVDADIEAHAGDNGIAAQYTGSEWYLQTGRATLQGQGDTWKTLINSLQGDAVMAGHYHAAADTPVSITAKLDKRPGAFALEEITLALGKGQLTGSAVLTVTDQPRLSIELTGAHIDLGFLFEPKDSEPLPGMAMPAYLRILPQLELDVTLDVEDLQFPTLQLGQAKASLARTEHGGKLVATGRGTDAGTLNLTLVANAEPNEPSDFQLTAKFADLDIPDMFRQQGLFNSRSTGTLTFSSKGDDMEAVFAAMRGTAKVAVDVRADNNWQRSALAAETLQFTGKSHLVIESDRIVGVVIDNLDIDSIEQAVTGKLSLVAGRSPWFVADLKSDRLNIDSLRALLPPSPETTESTQLVPLLQQLGAAQASLAIKSLSLYEMTLSDVEFEFVSAPSLIDLRQLDFQTENGSLKSQGKITFKGDNATLEGTAELNSIDLDQFLIASEDVQHIPVSGSAKVQGNGRDIAELVSNVTGYIELQAPNPAQGDAPEARRKLSLKATRLENGMEADISSLQWGDTQLSGTVRYYQTTPPRLDVDIHSGSLSLLPWEKAWLKENKKDKGKKTPEENTVASLARTSADFVGNVLLTPLRMLGDDDSTKPGDKLFSSEPLPLDALKDFDLKLSAKLDSVLSTTIAVNQLTLTGNLTGGQLTAKASSTELNKGNGDAEIALNVNATPPTIKLTSAFRNVHGLANQGTGTFPRSGFVSLNSRGQSEAEIAAHTSGLVFVELGKGPFDYANSMLLTANLATTVFQTLIPGIDKKKPELQCGVTVALFEDGKGATPYGFAARTNQANLLGHVHVDLAAETMQMSLDSRGRQGVGISVGSIFSNTVQIKGPLTDPGIVPDAAGLIWRGWAAVLTGGLSVLGETLFKRVLASENPCTSITDLIHKDLCPANPIAASSQMVCPSS